MPKRLKFVVEQWVFMVRWQTCHFRIESNRNVRFEFESNLEASQVPSLEGWGRGWQTSSLPSSTCYVLFVWTGCKGTTNCRPGLRSRARSPSSPSTPNWTGFPTCWRTITAGWDWTEQVVKTATMSTPTTCTTIEHARRTSRHRAHSTKERSATSGSWSTSSASHRWARSEDASSDRHRSVRNRPPSLRKIAAKSVQQFWRRCIPNQ